MFDLIAQGAQSLSLGVSAMAGHYDPDARLGFLILGADIAAKISGISVRGEYLQRRTTMALGGDPASRFKFGPGPGGRYDDTFGA